MKRGLGPTAVTLATLLAGCGMASSIHLTMTGEEAPEGGGYNISIRKVGGDPFVGLETKFVEKRSGTQDVSLVLETASALGAAVSVRVVVDSLQSADVTPPLARGDVVVELQPGGIAEAQVELKPDPRPYGVDLVAVLADPLASSGLAVHIEAASDAFVDINARAHVLHTWLVESTGRTWLGAYTSGSCESGCTYPLQGGPLLDRTDFSVELTAEAGESMTALTVSNGWPVYAGVPWLTVFPQLRSISADIGSLEMFADGIATHAGLAADSSTAAGKTMHSEHVFNILSADPAQDLDGVNGAQKPGGDANGPDFYLTRLLSDAETLSDDPNGGVLRQPAFGALGGCGTAALLALARTAASAVATSTATGAALDLLMQTETSAVSDLIGDASSGITCLRESWVGLSAFALTPQ